jgi:DNA-binding transcriptional LysR family regulator
MHSTPAILQVVPDADWNDLRYFLAIRRAGSLAGAARELRVDQTTVGRRLAALEDAFDARLFDRTPDGLVLTPAGDDIVAPAERIEDSVAEIERKIAGEDAKLQGSVRVSCSEAFATGFLVPSLPSLRELHPEVLVEVVTTSAMVDLARREADIAVRLRPRGTQPGQPDLIARQLGELAFALHGSRDYVKRRGKPKRPADLRGHDLVGYDEDMPPIPGVAWLRAPERDGRIVMRAQSILGLVAAIRGGIGLAVVPCFIVDADASLVRIGAPIDWAAMWLVAHPDVLRTARVRAVFDWLAQIITSARSRFRGGS